MTLAVIVAAAMFVGVIAYALFGGADFGSGFYDLTAGGGTPRPRTADADRSRRRPGVEANHVWLVYVLVIWWTRFPAAFAAAMTTLFVPLMFALAGIVLRGASFAFRKYAATFGQAGLLGAIFAGSSLIAPFFLGTVAGAIASGRVPAAGYGGRVGSWINPDLGGWGRGLRLASGDYVFLAGVFLTADAARVGEPDLASGYRIRTLVVGIVTRSHCLRRSILRRQRRADAQPRVAQSRPAVAGGGGARRRRRPRMLLCRRSYSHRENFRGRRCRGGDHGVGSRAVCPWMLVGSGHDQRRRRRPHRPRCTLLRSRRARAWSLCYRH